jgi:hypothetical protein
MAAFEHPEERLADALENAIAERPEAPLLRHALRHNLDAVASLAVFVPTPPPRAEGSETPHARRLAMMGFMEVAENPPIEVYDLGSGDPLRGRGEGGVGDGVGEDYPVAMTTYSVPPTAAPRIAAINRVGRLLLWDGDNLEALPEAGQAAMPPGAEVLYRMIAYHEPLGGLARLVTGAGDELTVWDGETGAILRRLGPEAWEIKVMIGFTSSFAGGVVRQCVATGGAAGGGVTVHDPDSGERVLRLDCVSEVTAMTSFEPAWAPGEACLVVALGEPSVGVWAVASGEQLQRITLVAGRVEGLAVYRTAGEEDRIVGGVSNGDTFVWDARSGGLVQHIWLDARAVPMATFRVRDGSPRLVTCGPGPLVKVWDPEAGVVLARMSDGLWGQVFELLVFEEGGAVGGEGGEEAVTPPGRVVLAAGDNHGTTVVWSVGAAMMRPEGQVLRAANKRG